MPVHPSLLGSYSPLSPPWPRASQICVFQTWNTIFSANAAFQFAWFWHYTQSLQLSQDFQRRGYRLPFHKAWDNPLSPRGHSKQGRRHLSDRETLRGNWTEGQNVQHQQQTKRAGDTQAGRICCAGCLFEQTLLFSPPSTSVLQLVTYCFTFSSTLLSPTVSFLLLLFIPSQRIPT